MAWRRIGPLALAATLLGCSYTLAYRPTPAAPVAGRDYDADLAACRDEADQWANDEHWRRIGARGGGTLILNILTGALPHAFLGTGLYWGAPTGTLPQEAVQRARACMEGLGWRFVEEEVTRGTVEH